MANKIDDAMQIIDSLGLPRAQHNEEYAPNTRETIRRHTIHQFMAAGIVRINPDLPESPVNSPRTVYQITPDVLRLVRSYGTDLWPLNLTRRLGDSRTLASQYAAERDYTLVPVRMDQGPPLNLSAGSHSTLIRAIIEEFAPRFSPGGKLIYVGDTGDRLAYLDADSLAHLGRRVDAHRKMPDVVIHSPERGWLLLIEAVTSHGPVDGKRHAELSDLFSAARAGLIFVTAFPSHAVLARWLSKIAWETEVWIAEVPSHLIHFDGDRFLGPYASPGGGSGHE